MNGPPCCTRCGLIESGDRSKCGDIACSPALLLRRCRRRLLTPTPPHPLRPLLQQTGNLACAKECYERAATGQERQKSGWHAAKALEKAGEVAKELGLWDDVEAHYTRAAELFAEEGRPQAAAEAAARGARALEERRPEVGAGRGQEGGGGCWVPVVAGMPC